MSAFVYAAAAAVLVGFSKAGMPGAAIPAVAFMAEAFRDDTRLSVGAMLPILLLGDLFALAFYRRHANWKRLWELVPYIVAGMVPAYVVLQYIPGDTLRRLLGIIVLSMLSLHVLRQRLGWANLPHHRAFTAVTGLLAGFGTTVGNAAGPVMGIYLVSQRLAKHEFLGTSAWLFFLVNASKIPGFVTLGMITPDTLRLDAWIAPWVLVGVVAGVWVARRMPQIVFDTLVLVLAGVAGARLTFW